MWRCELLIQVIKERDLRLVKEDFCRHTNFHSQLSLFFSLYLFICVSIYVYLCPLTH